MLLSLDSGHGLVEGSASSLLDAGLVGLAVDGVHGIGRDELMCIFAVLAANANFLIVKVAADFDSRSREAGGSWSRGKSRGLSFDLAVGLIVTYTIIQDKEINIKSKTLNDPKISNSWSDLLFSLSI